MTSVLLTGKVALVVGASRGIGRAAALGLAEAGADLGLIARDGARLAEVARAIEAGGRRAAFAAGDVGDRRAITASVDEVAERLGRLDVVLISVGAPVEVAPLADGDPERWAGAVSVFLLGTYHVARAVVPHLRRAGGGRIIHVGSGLARLPSEGRSAYAASKAGAWMMVRTLALELARDGIDVNEIIPGPVRSELLTPAAAARVPETEHLKLPEEVVPMVVYLAGYPAGGPTGQSFSLARRPL